MLYVLTIKIGLRKSFSLYATIKEFIENRARFCFLKKFITNPIKAFIFYIKPLLKQHTQIPFRFTIKKSEK